MELYKKHLLSILNSAIIEKKYIGNNQEAFEWEKIIQETEKHDMSALVYYSINKEKLKEIDKHILNKWKVDIFKSNITQINILNYSKEVLYALEKKEINVIVLKGFVLKNFYPRPEFRTMCDLDILIDWKDYKLVEECLISIGYTCERTKHPVHKIFYCENGLEVEVHWKLVNNEYYKGDIREFEDNVWIYTKEISIYGVKIKTLSDEDFLIHICLHMAVHTKCSGFGLRQLYDLAVFTRNKYEDIDWENFKERIYKYGLLTFVEGLYELCYELFEMKVPCFNLKNTNLKREHIDLLLENIIYFGVNADVTKSTDTCTSYCKINYYLEFKKMIQIIFETQEELSLKYSYVRKYYFLLPIAWIHRIFRGIREYGLIKSFKGIRRKVELRGKKSEISSIFNL